MTSHQTKSSIRLLCFGVLIFTLYNATLQLIAPQPSRHDICPGHRCDLTKYESFTMAADDYSGMFVAYAIWLTFIGLTTIPIGIFLDVRNVVIFGLASAILPGLHLVTWSYVSPFSFDVVWGWMITLTVVAGTSYILLWLRFIVPKNKPLPQLHA